MSDKEYKKYDTDSKFEIYAARLAKDAEVVKVSNGDMVKVTFVDTSKGETDEDLWVEAVINDGQAELAAQLQKGDVVPSIEGKLTAKRSEQDETKIFYNLKRARLHLGVSLLMTLRERADGAESKPKAGAKKGGKPAGKVTPAKKPKKPVVDVSDDDEDEDADEDE